jgi:CheY-like chemotaxis protein
LNAERAILVVDDEAILLMALRQELRSELGASYRYEIAMSAKEGLSLFDELSAEGVRIALVISDWLMPGMKGDEFLMRIHETHPEVRTIMVSGQIDEGQLDLLKSSGTLDVFMRKPWSSKLLLAECSRLLAN